MEKNIRNIRKEFKEKRHFLHYYRTGGEVKRNIGGIR